MSAAAEIALALANRVAAISVEDGYATDIGTRVYRGRRRLDKEHIPCIVILEGDDAVRSQSGTDVKLTQRYGLEGHAPCDPDQPNDMAHLIIADLKRAVFADDRTLGSRRVKELAYVGRSIAPREDGLALVAAAIEIEITFVENLASP